MNDKQKNFIVLRADSVSFDKIAIKLKTTKKTLIEWSKLYKDDIEDLQLQDIRDLKEQYRYDKKSQYETLLKQLERFNSAIDEAYIKRTKLKDLLQARNDTMQKLEDMETDSIKN